MESRKRCSKCGRLKGRHLFSPHSKTRDGLQSWCKVCFRNQQAMWRKTNPKRNAERKRVHSFSAYGYQRGDYDRLLSEQGGRCAICGTDDPGPGRRNFDVDHCHDRDQIRQLLCHRCNKGLGGFNDDPETIRKAAEYIEYHRSRHAQEEGCSHDSPEAGSETEAEVPPEVQHEGCCDPGGGLPAGG